MSLDERECITLLMMVGWGNNRRSHEEACHLFNEYYHERQPISRKTVGRTVQRFMETGSVSDRHSSGRPAIATTEDNSLDVLQSFIENLQESLRSAAQTHDISFTSIKNILKGSNFKPYKVHLYPLKVNVWLGVIGTQLAGPFFIEGNLNAISHQRLLENEIKPALRNMFGEHFQNIWFQQDGAPPHYGIDAGDCRMVSAFTRSVSIRLFCLGLP
ncbi:hypothetical protein J6590_034593 [Homalodisca vitripennis]|nr:hypothetical protein J6590_034593 [Homalodisca vitripennis]